MAGLEKGSIDVLCILIGSIGRACEDLDGITEENKVHTTRIMKALNGICADYLRKDIDGEFKFLDDYLNGKK